MDSVRHESSQNHTVGRQVAVDVLAALALVVVLVLVYSLDRRADRATTTTNGDSAFILEEVEQPTSASAEQSQPLRLAVTPPEFDDVGRLLRQLGAGYAFNQIQLVDLLDEHTLGKYDVVFVTCGQFPDSWLGESVGDGPRNSKVLEWNRETVARLRESLRQFVHEGGVLYASDWRFSILQAAFPEFIGQGGMKQGSAQDLMAEVTDAGLRDVIGDRVPLHFDLDGWFPANVAGRGVKTYLRGEYTNIDGDKTSAPLLVRFSTGRGTVVFTSFHNEKQNSETELQLLKYLVFATVTSRVDSQATETMVKGGFSSKKHNLLSTSSGDPSVTKTYICTQPGELHFVLAFEKQGGLLELTVTGPDGRTHMDAGDGTFVVKIDDAQVGEWGYTVVAKKVPYDNFPFTLTVWQK